MTPLEITSATDYIFNPIWQKYTKKLLQSMVCIVILLIIPSKAGVTPPLPK